MKKNNHSALTIVLIAILTLSYSCKKDNAISSTHVKVSLGQSYQGGIVGYILLPGDIGYDSTTQHGLIVARNDQGMAQWFNGTYILTQADNQNIGGGKSNTALIIASQGNYGCAASLCDTLSIGGYRDWYLPDLNELSLIMRNAGAIAGFSGNVYWTSNEESANVADGQSMSQAVIYGSWVCPKTATHSVRAIRGF